MNNIADAEKAGIFEIISLVSGEQEFCIEITSIREIRRWDTVTRLPNTQDSILGVMNLRGAVIPIIDLAVQLGLGNTKIGDRSVVVVAAVGAKVMGLLVGTVSEILSIDPEEIKPNPTSGRDEAKNHVIGLISVNNAMLRLLDLESLIIEIPQGAAA